MPAVKPRDQETNRSGRRSARPEEVASAGGGGSGCVVGLVLVGALLTTVGLVAGLIRWLG
jgi:hypothetical protein